MTELSTTLIGGVCVASLLIGGWVGLRAARGALGFRLARPLGAWLGWCVGRLLGVRRRHVRAAMARAQIPEETADAMYAQLGRGVFELGWLSLPGQRDLKPLVEVTERLAPWLAAERGVVVATAHTGNWDLAACAVAQRMQSAIAQPMPGAAHAGGAAGSGGAREVSTAPKLLVVTKHFSQRWLDRVWQRLRGSYGVDLVSAGEVWSRARNELPRGSAICMIVDQAPERARSVQREPFLGAACDVDQAPALLAARLRVPLIAVFPERRPDGSLRLDLAAHCPVPTKADRQWVAQATRRLTQALELSVRQRPAQWLWMHRRWKAAPPPKCLELPVSDAALSEQ